MAQKRTGKKSDGKRTNYKKMYSDAQEQLECLRAEIEDVNAMLDAIECPPNCGTINGRMVEYARKNFRRYGASTNPGADACKMLRAVAAPVGTDGPPWALRPRAEV